MSINNRVLTIGVRRPGWWQNTGKVFGRSLIGRWDGRKFFAHFQVSLFSLGAFIYLRFPKGEWLPNGFPDDGLYIRARIEQAMGEKWMESRRALTLAELFDAWQAAIPTPHQVRMVEREQAAANARIKADGSGDYPTGMGAGPIRPEFFEKPLRGYPGWADTQEQRDAYDAYADYFKPITVGCAF